jgi:hypothetical protein
VQKGSWFQYGMYGVGLLGITNHDQPGIQRTHQQSSAYAINKQSTSTSWVKYRCQLRRVHLPWYVCEYRVSTINRQPSSAITAPQRISDQRISDQRHQIYKTNSFDRKTRNPQPVTSYLKRRFGYLNIFRAKTKNELISTPDRRTTEETLDTPSRWELPRGLFWCRSTYDLRARIQ